MRKTVQILLTYFISTGICLAQNAEKVFEEAARAYEKSNGIAAQFSTHTQFEKQGISESFEGTIRMKGDKFVLILPDTRTWYDGKTQWTYGIHSDEVYVSTPEGDELQFLNPMILLRTYQKGFNLIYKGESTADTGRPAYDIQLVAKGNSDIEKIDIQIEKASSLPVRMTVFMKNGMRSLIRIRDMQTGINQPDSFFKFNPVDFPDAIEIDLR